MQCNTQVKWFRTNSDISHELSGIIHVPEISGIIPINVGYNIVAGGHWTYSTWVGTVISCQWGEGEGGGGGELLMAGV